MMYVARTVGANTVLRFTSMTRYILEKDLPLAAPNDGGEIVRWKIRENGTNREAATLTRSDEMFLAESERFRTTAESADPFLALRTVLRTDDIWIEENGELRKLRPSDLE